jgi:hypothetical protein
VDRAGRTVCDVPWHGGTERDMGTNGRKGVGPDDVRGEVFGPKGIRVVHHGH